MSNPDALIASAATGMAAKLAARHAEDHALKLYGAWFCPFVQRSWIVLEEKKIPYQWIEVDPYKREAEFVKLNPRCLVPVLVVPQSADSATGNKEEEQRKPLVESSIIDEYLEDEYSDVSKYGPRLMPVDPYERSRARIWIDHISTRIVPAYYRFLQHTPEKAYSLDEARKALHDHIKTLVEAMDAKGPWFLGETISLVDISLAPWAERLFLLDYYKQGGLQIPERGGDNGGVWDRWAVWTRAVHQRQSVVDTMSDTEQYIRSYKRYADDTTKSQVGQATREGRRLP